MSASESCLSCRCISPADPTLKGREEMSARDTSISSKVLLDRIKTVESWTACDEKEMSSTINCLMIDSTQWLIVPCADFRGPSSAKHWSMVKTFKACSSPSDRSILARVGARRKSTASVVSWSRAKSHRGNDGHDPLLILQCQNHMNMAAMYRTSSSCLIFSNLVRHGGSIMLLASKCIQGITRDRLGLIYPTNGTSLQSGSPISVTFQPWSSGFASYSLEIQGVITRHLLQVLLLGSTTPLESCRMLYCHP